MREACCQKCNWKLGKIISFHFFAFFCLKKKKDELHYHFWRLEERIYQDEIHKTWEGKEGAQMIT